MNGIFRAASFGAKQKRQKKSRRAIIAITSGDDETYQQHFSALCLSVRYITITLEKRVTLILQDEPPDWYLFTFVKVFSTLQPKPDLITITILNDNIMIKYKTILRLLLLA